MAIIPESQYPGKITPASTEYPYGQARNVTLPGDGTGTPWDAPLVNDIFGFQQALLEKAQITPTGDPDEVGASQYLDALHSLMVVRLNDATGFQGVDSSNLVGGYQFSIVGYDPDSDVGGGTFYFDSARPKSDHNGGTVFSPTVPWDGLQATKADFLNGVGETDPGGSGVFVRRYNGISADAGLNGKWFGARPGVSVDNYPSIQAAVDLAVSSGILCVKGMDGAYEIAQTVNFHTTGIVFEMSGGAKTHTGGTASGAKLIWTGGAAPMMAASTSQITFRGFTIENQGTATDWLELNSGSQNNIYENLYCVASNDHTAFTRSVIRSNGNRVGYSQFRHVTCNSGAPVFLDIDGQGTSNGITPIHFGERCIFGSNTAPLTVIRLFDETVENIDIRNCTFNQFGFELTVIDSVGTPAAVAANSVSFCDNELDASVADDSLWRFFKLENVNNIIMTGNTVNAGGTKTHIADLINSNVAQFEGNHYISLVTAFFDADDNSKVISGVNKGSSRPAFVNVNSGIVNLAYGPGVSIDGRDFCLHKHEVLHLDVTNGSGYTLNIDTTTPEYITVGQVFTIAVRNVSGGAIAAPTFGVTFETSGATTAPADGFSRLYTFYWSGSKAVEISRVGGDVAN